MKYYYLYSSIKGTDYPFNCCEGVFVRAADVFAHISKYRSKPTHISHGKKYKIYKEQP